MIPSAILSTTVIPLDGVYKVGTYGGESLEPIKAAIKDVPHYIGHPSTKEIVEGLGAVPAPSKLFTGLLVGQVAYCFSITQGKSDRSQGGTAINQEVGIGDLTIRIVERIQ